MDAIQIARFWSKVDVRRAEECWPWKAHINSINGYGYFNIGGVSHTAHRLAFEIVNGRPPTEGLCVMHACDNRPCCNPHHLIEGTQLENMRDCVAKGRQARQKGEQAGRAKLTASDVLAIANACRDGVESQSSIARRYGIDPSQVSAIWLNKTWRHLSVPRASGRPKAPTSAGGQT